MSTFTANIDSLLGGVSQRATYHRLVNEAETVINMIPQPERGLGKRPPTDHEAIIATSGLAAFSNAFIHSILRDANERYRVVILNGVIRVFDVDGTEITVKTPDGVSYLSTSVTSPNIDFRAASIADTTMIVNRNITPAKLTTRSPAKVFQALVYVRDADFDTNFTLRVGGTQVVHRTLAANDPLGLDSINTTTVSNALTALVNTSIAGFTAVQYGSALHIVQDSGADFTIEVEDGLGGEGLIAIKNKTQKFEDLPPQAPNGFLVEITGDPTSQFDNYFVEYSDADAIDERGFWVETVKPNEEISLDASTMPHELVRNGAIIPSVVAEPPLPDPTVTVVGATSEQTEHFATSLNGTEAADLVLNLPDEEGFANLDNANNISTKYELTFDLDVSGIGSHTATIELYYNDGVASTNWTLGNSRTYVQADGIISGALLNFTTALDANFDVRVKLVYDSTPLVTEQAFFTMKGLRYTPASTDRNINYGSTQVYPEGVTVTININSNPVTHLVTGGDSTGAAVATAMTSSLNAEPNITATNPSSGVVLIVDSGGTPTIVPSTDFDNSKRLITTGLGVAADSLINDVIENITDGSTMTVTDNTDKTLVGTTALTGGTTNTFQTGDVCRIVSTGTYFVFRQATWDDRATGDLETNPFPSFIGNPIKDVFYYKNRLGFLADENVIMSRTGDLFDFFRSTVTDLLDTDPIDVSGVSAQVQLLTNAMQWNKQLIVSSGVADFVLSGEPLLSPKTARLEQVSKYGASGRVRPVELGGDIYFTKTQNNSTLLYRYRPNPNGRDDSNEAILMNAHASTFIAGNPLAMVGSSTYDMIAILTDDDKTNLYVYKFFDDGEARLQSAFVKWDFGDDCEILGMDFLDNNMGLVTKHHDMITFLTMPVDAGYTDPFSTTHATHLDRRVAYGPTITGSPVTAEYDQFNDWTTFTLPYAVRYAGNQPIAKDRFTGDQIDPIGHVPDFGFGGWAGQAGGAFTAYAWLRNDRLQIKPDILNLNVTPPSMVAVTDYVFPTGLQETFGAYAKFHRQGDGNEAQEMQQFLIRGNGNQNANGFEEGIGIGYQTSATNPDEVTIIVVEYWAFGGTTTNVATGVSFPRGTNLYIGCDIATDVLTIWTAPETDISSKTTVGTHTVAQAGLDADDASRRRGGTSGRFDDDGVVSAANLPWLDDYTVYVASTDDDGDVCAATKPVAASNEPMAPQIGGVSQTQGADASAGVVLSVPSGGVAGDVLYVFLSSDDAFDDWTGVPAGWTEEFNTVGSGNQHRSAIYSRVMDGTETATYTWTLSAAEGYCAAMMLIKNVNSTLLDVATTENVENNVEPQATTVTTVTDECLIVRATMMDGGNNAPVTPPIANHVQHVNLEEANECNLIIVSHEQVTAGATGNYQFDTSAVDQANSYTIAFRRGTTAIAADAGGVEQTVLPRAGEDPPNQVRISGDQRLAHLWFGMCYPMTYQFSKFHRQDRSADGQPRLRSDGHLTVVDTEVDYTDTRGFTLTAEIGRDAGTVTKTATFLSASAPADGSLRIPVQAKNEWATVSLTDTSPYPCWFQRARWRGRYFKRGR